MKFYRALLNNGEWITENEKPWDEIKDKVIRLEFNNNGQIISFPKNATNFAQSKTASGNLLNGECQIESRNFSFSLGNIIVSVRVKENTNNISLTCQLLQSQLPIDPNP